MNELHELPSPIKELNEVPSSDGLKNLSSELTRQEADDKIAALLEERQAAEIPDIGITYSEKNKMLSLANDAQKAQSKANLLERELNSLKAKRRRELDPAKQKQLDRDIADQDKKVKAAKANFAAKDKTYKNYVISVTHK